MSELWTILWAVLGIILIVAEVFTAGFVLLWFGVGALAAALLAYLGFGVGLQFLIFAVVSVVLTALSRTIFLNYFSRLHRTGNQLKSGVDALPGQIGTVTKASHGALSQGEVNVFGSTWRAFPEAGEEPLQEGERVKVVRVQGASIYVRRADDRLPEWRKYNVFIDKD
jgi:membrane protein implicated in regulation of membrane protease activity